MVLVYRWIDTVHTSHVVLVTSQTSKEPQEEKLFCTLLWTLYKRFCTTLHCLFMYFVVPSRSLAPTLGRALHTIQEL